MPDNPAPVEAQDGDKRKREAYLLWIAALTAGVDEFEAKIQADFERYMQGVNAGAEIARGRMERELRRGLEFGPGGSLDARASRLISTRNKVDGHIWDWREKSLALLGLVAAGPTIRGADKTVEVFNRWYRVDLGGPAARARSASGAAIDAISDAGRTVNRIGAIEPIPVEKAVLGAKSALYALLPGIVASLIDNPVRAIEQRAYQASISAVDATSGPMSEAAIADVGRRFTAPSGVLKASILTHQRAAFRSTVASFAAVAGAGAYVYYVPARERPRVAPTGFAASHYGMVKTEREWRGTMNALDHKRPGSYMFSTGFHVLDPGYLLPIPLGLLAVAREIERRRRQIFLERKRAEAGT